MAGASGGGFCVFRCVRLAVCGNIYCLVPQTGKPLCPEWLTIIACLAVDVFALACKNKSECAEK
jgi:hypothetical protein